MYKNTKDNVKKDNINWKDVDKQIYESKLSDYIEWIHSAEALIASAKELEEKILEIYENRNAHAKNSSIPLKADYYQGPYFLLVAYAVENYLKAVIIKKKSSQIREDFRKKTQFPQELKCHNLVELAELAGFKCDLEEEDLLRRLTRNAVWAGRYPLPLNFSHLDPQEKFSNGKQYLISRFHENDIKRVKNLVEKIKEYIKNCSIPNNLREKRC